MLKKAGGTRILFLSVNSTLFNNSGKSEIELKSIDNCHHQILSLSPKKQPVSNSSELPHVCILKPNRVA